MTKIIVKKFIANKSVNKTAFITSPIMS